MRAAGAKGRMCILRGGDKPSCAQLDCLTGSGLTACGWCAVHGTAGAWPACTEKRQHDGPVRPGLYEAAAGDPAHALPLHPASTLCRRTASLTIIPSLPTATPGCTTPPTPPCQSTWLCGNNLSHSSRLSSWECCSEWQTMCGKGCQAFRGHLGWGFPALQATL